MWLFLAETEPHEGKRKQESLWPIFKVHHQKSRYIYDLFYRRKAISKGKTHFNFLIVANGTAKLTNILFLIQNFMITAWTIILQTEIWLQNGKRLVTRTYVVWGVFRLETQTLEPTAYAGCQKESLRKEGLLNASTVDAGDVQVEHWWTILQVVYTHY